jgi:tetratricopeptide (TPR) repeat protein
VLERCAKKIGSKD